MEQGSSVFRLSHAASALPGLADCVLVALRAQFTLHWNSSNDTTNCFSSSRASGDPSKKKCWRVNPLRRFFLHFPSLSPQSLGSASRSKRKKLVGIIWYFTPDQPNPISLSLLDLASFVFTAWSRGQALDSPQYTHCSLFMPIPSLPLPTSGSQASVQL